MRLKAPFPWFGGKSRAAHLVWPRLGDVKNYVEPFAGSLAILLARPHDANVETVNDKDAYIANFWRAVQADPEHVAWWADYPVNEADLHARHRWLVGDGRMRVERTMREPEYCDFQVAGWWVWGQCLWIGSGWCAAPGHRRGEVPSEQRKRPHGDKGSGRGVHSDAMGFGRMGDTVNQRRRPQLSADQGVTTSRRFQGGGQAGGSGVHSPSLWRQLPDHARTTARRRGLIDWFAALSERMRRVRVCCGDWSRVLTPSITTYIGVTGVVLDPPYSQELREICYSEDHDISEDVRAWALEHADDPKLRIALCGYDGEHEMPESWECVKWKAHGGYSRTERGVANRAKERIWFSPHCLRPSDQLNFDAPDEMEVGA